MLPSTFRRRSLKETKKPTRPNTHGVRSHRLTHKTGLPAQTRSTLSLVIRRSIYALVDRDPHSANGKFAAAGKFSVPRSQTPRRFEVSPSSRYTRTPSGGWVANPALRRVGSGHLAVGDAPRWLSWNSRFMKELSRCIKQSTLLLYWLRFFSPETSWQLVPLFIL